MKPDDIQSMTNHLLTSSAGFLRITSLREAQAKTFFQTFRQGRRYFRSKDQTADSQLRIERDISIHERIERQPLLALVDVLTKEVAQHFTQHVRRVLAGFAATTVIRYITTFNGFARTCEELEVCILSITEVQAADILVTLQLQKREGLAVGSSAVTCIKAVRWVHRNAQCCVFQVFYGSVICLKCLASLARTKTLKATTGEARENYTAETTSWGR